MKTTTQTDIEQAGTIIVNAAMKLVARHPNMNARHIDAVVAAMKAAAPRVTDQLIDDLKNAPTVSNYAVHAAVLELASAGYKAIGGIN